MRIFLDANVLFSAAKSDGAVRRLLHMLGEAGHECWADDYVAEEARRNIASKAPDAVSVLEGILSTLRRPRAHRVASPPKAARALPEKDQPVLAAAIGAGCQALVTGDRTHFGGFYGKTLGGVTIHSPRSLAETIFL